ncbi:Lariat debranching enzyme [Ceratobasidium theobromae]|uniref:Lariat debranching enzyme n=1 Tax=Ceratobasidium theobromae TaxID=1582974 RepID=A0A5N5QUZ4_9AGAM|nr:Lariat debranching enzyme [Ceratobasidium theobromae]
MTFGSTLCRRATNIVRTNVKMRVAVAGCCHGQLDATFKQVNDLESQNGYKIDVVLINGDFQAVRNHQDLQCMAVPDKYKQLGTFYKYYIGQVAAPVLTIVIGGNHEASNYMWELYHGGWLAPNIYYLGGSGCVKVNGLRIAGASGIYKSHDYRLGEFINQLSSPDVFMSHDWPVDITRYGDQPQLLKRKPFFQSDIEKGELGSPPMMDLLYSLRPGYWFSAHMHCRFEAVVEHDSDASGDQTSAVPAETEAKSSRGTANAPAQVNPDEIQLDDLDELPSTDPIPPVPVHNPDEIMIHDDSVVVPTADSVPAPEQNDGTKNTAGSAAAPNTRPSPSKTSTRFLALDKCLPKRHYMDVLEIAPSTSPSGQVTSPPTLTFDREWLAISRALHPYLSTQRQQPAMPPPWDMAPLIQDAQRWVDKNVGEREIRRVQEFVMTAPGPVNRNPRPASNLPQRKHPLFSVWANRRLTGLV